MKKWILILGFLTINLMLGSIRAEEPDRSICGDYYPSYNHDYGYFKLFDDYTFSEFNNRPIVLKGTWKQIHSKVLCISTDNLDYYQHYHTYKVETSYFKMKDTLCIKTHFLMPQQDVSRSITVNVNGKLFTTRDSVLKIPYQAIEFQNDSLINVRFFMNRYGSVERVFQSRNPPVVIFNKAFNLSEINTLDVQLPYYEYYISKTCVYNERYVVLLKNRRDRRILYRPNRTKDIILFHNNNLYVRWESLQKDK